MIKRGNDGKMIRMMMMMMQRKQPLAIRKCHKNRPGLGLVMGLGRGFFREEFLAALLAEGLKLLLALRRELRVRHAHHDPGGEAERRTLLADF